MANRDVVGVAQDDIGNGNGHEFLRELRVKTAMVERQRAAYRRDADGWRTGTWWASRRTTSVMATVM
ncbi:hypothetical protein CKQ79_29400, partial [Klebsiella pneumoniae]